MKNQFAKPRYFSCEEAFVIALKNCTDNSKILKAVERIKEDCLVGSNDMSAYDDFVTVNSSLRYCYGCQGYHDTTETEFEEKSESCRYIHEGFVDLNRSLYEQGIKRREEVRDEYYHR